MTHIPGVNIENPLDVVYLKGDDTTDDSIRFILDIGDTFLEIEKRINGIWNPTGLQITDRFLIDDNTGNNLTDSFGNLIITV